jgi:ankyrin repeat protein
MASQEEQTQQHVLLQAQRHQRQMAIRAQQQAVMRQQQTTIQMTKQMDSKLSHQMGNSYDDIPIKEPGDVDILNERPVSPEYASFLSACRDGDISTAESIVSSQSRTPAFLHHALAAALSNGRVNIARYLLESGAPIARKTPEFALTAPVDKQVALFEILTEHGWTVNTPGFYGAVLLPRLIQTNNEILIDWFLAHGADPNLGSQHNNWERLGGPDKHSCQALELAASQGSAHMVQKLLNAGAKITNGAPLYHAAGASPPPGANPHAGPIMLSKEFDSSRIPAMVLLVENGAGVNDKFESRHMTPQYPIVNAVMAGAVERLKWLLSQGADPDLKGQYGSARDYAKVMSSDEMKQALGLL